MALIFDPNVYPYIESALDCIRDELECQGVGVCRYDTLIAAQDQLDGCDCCENTPDGTQGRVWARATDVTAVEGPRNIPNCPPSFVAAINFGISRCAVTGENLPSSDVLRDQAVRGYADMHAIYMALSKCDSRRWPTTMNRWTPIGPSGGCYGGIWSVELRVGLPIMARIDAAGMAELKQKIVREVDRTATRVRNQIQRRTPVDTGTTRAGWQIRHSSTGNTITATVYNKSDVALYLHTGTGIYGPRGREIRPVRADALRFKPKGSSRYIYRMSSRGYPPSSYIIRGLRAGTNWPVTVYYPDGRMPR